MVRIVLGLVLLLALAGCGGQAAMPTATVAPEPTATAVAVPTETVEARPETKPAVGFSAPDFAVFATDGREIRLSELRGKAVWINFWTSYCHACLEEMPQMEQIYQQHKGQLEIIGIDTLETKEVWAAFLGSRDFSWTFAEDPDNSFRKLYPSPGLPTHVFVNGDGIITKFAIGGLTREKMDLAVAAALAASPR